METIVAPTRWNLDSLLYGLDLDSLNKNMISMKEKLINFEACLTSNALNENQLITLSEIIKQIESAESFYYCLSIENIEPTFLTLLNANISTLKSHVRCIISSLQELLSNMNEQQLADWSKSINHKKFISELTNDTTRITNGEKIISSFARETLSCFEDIYVQLRNNLKVKVNVELDHGKTELSFTEAMRISMSHPEPSNRQDVFKGLNQSLKTQAGVFCSIYNQMVGLRLNENKIKNVDYLDESLKLNGISQSTLNAMWDVVDSNLHVLSKYLVIKAREVDKEKLTWHELMTSSQEISHQITFSEAIDLIIKSLGNMDANISQFIKKVISNRWVDAEQRDTKPLGGFCAPFIAEGESRISLSYDDSIDSARRLAHELGHAWHFQQMKDVPSLLFSEETFEMTMAETSSIFFETAFIDFVIQNTNDVSIKKEILEWKIKRSLNYLMSIRGAYLFENQFYECRKKGQIDANQMEELSLQCQEKAYGNGLCEYEPFLWIKYGQFYQANIPFYNYPYSFGFLFSIGLLEIAKGDELFHKKFQEFLSETGMLPLEQLVKRHFNIDLSLPEFWQQSIQQCLTDIEHYNNCMS
ncbi:M3 family metallopeptidase [Paenibacillus sp. KN14-4R]|uniref:M3 family metallopeptidase n=1 Tax=Paenibacillus sp. KN14-4R TaxID=3445773 RepID=UPI003FA010BD